MFTTLENIVSKYYIGDQIGYNILKKGQIYSTLY